jgi:DUF4097 and DUF4098 domain-containing protein YvlB
MSRASIVAMLVAVEIAIVGIALYTVRNVASVHAAGFVAKTIAPLDAGSAPLVAIDDADSRVDVAPSSDGLVHVKDFTDVHGSFFGSHSSIAQLTVKRTTDGVSISRPSSGSVNVAFWWSERRIEVDVPGGSRLEIARCSGAHVSGVEGGVAVASQDGRITLTDLRGTIQAKSDDGSITATRVRGDSLVLQSSDGHLKLEDVSASSLDAQTRDGSIEAHGLAIAGGAQHAVLHTGDGSIRVALATGADLTVDASTSDGHIDVDGNAASNGDSDSAQRTVRVGNGSGSLQLSSGDGSIHLITNGAV